MSNRVLYIEDDEQWRTIVTNSLQAAGYEVLTARSSEEALPLADQGKFVLFLLDMSLQGEDSLMLMKFLKHNHPDVPVVLYSDAQQDDAAVENMRNAGAADCLPKASMEELLVNIGYYLQ